MRLTFVVTNDEMETYATAVLETRINVVITETMITCTAAVL